MARTEKHSNMQKKPRNKAVFVVEEKTIKKQFEMLTKVFYRSVTGSVGNFLSFLAKSTSILFTKKGEAL